MSKQRQKLLEDRLVVLGALSDDLEDHFTWINRTRASIEGNDVQLIRKSNSFYGTLIYSDKCYSTLPLGPFDRLCHRLYVFSSKPSLKIYNVFIPSYKIFPCVLLTYPPTEAPAPGETEQELIVQIEYIKGVRAEIGDHGHMVTAVCNKGHELLQHAT